MLTVLLPRLALATTVYEGFYRIERDRKHVGFAVQRLKAEGDLRVLTSYFRFKRPDESLAFESYRTTTDARGRPISTEHRGTHATLAPVWAQFASGGVRTSVGRPNARRPATLSNVNITQSALFLIADLSKLLVGTIYSYRAYADEFGEALTGTLHVAKPIAAGGQTIRRVVVDYRGEVTEHFVGDGGQPLGSRAYSGDLVCYWVGTRKDAIDIFAYPDRDVIALFGDLPESSKNIWSKIPNLNASKIIRDVPKWRGPRVRTPAALGRTQTLPVRAK